MSQRELMILGIILLVAWFASSSSYGAPPMPGPQQLPAYGTAPAGPDTMTADAWRIYGQGSQRASTYRPKRKVPGNNLMGNSPHMNSRSAQTRYPTNLQNSPVDIRPPVSPMSAPPTTSNYRRPVKSPEALMSVNGMPPGNWMVTQVGKKTSTVNAQERELPLAVNINTAQPPVFAVPGSTVGKGPVYMV